ncbi:MAG: class I SAM-dependent methyltransferase [Acidimicrobiales bacterium]
MDVPLPNSVPDYGDSFADVYDDWYADITDAAATADRVATLAAGGRVLELGVGSGRVAIPIADRGHEVVGIDASPAMLEVLAAKDHAGVQAVHGDMSRADEVVDGPFAVVLVAFNTFFNLADDEAQRRCMEAVRAVVAPEGSFLVEAFVPGDPPDRLTRDLSTSRVTADRVVLSATEHDPVAQTVVGQHVDIGTAGTRLRPWRIRYLHPHQLDEMADAAGFELVERHGGWNGEPFDADTTVHVSRYRPRRGGSADR